MDVRYNSLPTIESLDLTSNGVLKYFAQSTHNVQLLNFLLSLDQIDSWAFDHQSKMLSPQTFDIKIILQELESLIKDNVNALHHVPQELSEILSHLTTTRCLYLLSFISQQNPKFIDLFSLLLEDKQSREISTIRQRLEAFSKAKLLGEIFSTHRLNRIAKIMGSYSDV